MFFNAMERFGKYNDDARFNPCKILDLGTGQGNCILIFLKFQPSQRSWEGS